MVLRGGAGVCFPADPRTFYEKNDGDDPVTFEVNIAPNNGDMAALTGISFYHATGLTTL